MKPFHASLMAAVSLCSLASCKQEATTPSSDAPTQAAAAPAQSPCPVAGRYAVAGQQPGGAGAYAGEAEISASKTGCNMRWFPPNESSGSGTFSNGVLTISFTFANGGSGQVNYAQAANGVLQGQWWMDGDKGNQGSETLSPL